jgi:hypothetical protein
VLRDTLSCFKRFLSAFFSQLTTLQSLSPELFYHEIFIYLNSEELLDAFFHINILFDNLIYAYLYKYVDLGLLDFEITHHCHLSKWVKTQAHGKSGRTLYEHHVI